MATESMQAVLALVNRLQGAATTLGDVAGGDKSLPSLWDMLPTIVVIGGQVWAWWTGAGRRPTGRAKGVSVGFNARIWWLASACGRCGAQPPPCWWSWPSTGPRWAAGTGLQTAGRAPGTQKILLPWAIARWPLPRTRVAASSASFPPSYTQAAHPAVRCARRAAVGGAVKGGGRFVSRCGRLTTRRLLAGVGGPRRRRPHAGCFACGVVRRLQAGRGGDVGTSKETNAPTHPPSTAFPFFPFSRPASRPSWKPSSAATSCRAARAS